MNSKVLKLWGLIPNLPRFNLEIGKNIMYTLTHCRAVDYLIARYMTTRSTLSVVRNECDRLTLCYFIYFSLLYRLALYVYEYLLHVGAQKTAQTFLSEVKS